MATSNPPNVFRQRLASGENMRQAITHGGVTGAHMRGLRLDLNLTLGDMAHVLGTSERSVMRKEKIAAPLSVSEADRAYRLARVADLAFQILGDEERAKRWLKMPQQYLGYETPIEALDTEIGTDLVLQSLYAIGYGGVG
jgi:putative toxin-antitoxin system antitoxin component (TIGR02293 family)